MSNRTCIICQTELTGRQQNACSAICANKVYSNRRRESGRLKNANLTAESVQRKLDAQRRWRKANKKIVACPTCGKETVKQAGSDRTACSVTCGLYGSRGIKLSNCKELVYVAPVPKSQEPPVTVIRGSWFTSGFCAVCGKSFTSRHTDKTCGTKCQRKLHRTGARSHRFPITPSKRFAIYKRDNYTCQLCGVPVPMTSEYDPQQWNPLWPSLDHITPRSLQDNPDHSAENLRLAHVLCNSHRNNDTNWRPTYEFIKHIEAIYLEKFAA